MRVDAWIADRVRRLGHRGSASLGRIRVRYERVVDALWDGWDRSLGGGGARWDPISHRFRVRRERLVDALWEVWDRSLGSLSARWEPTSNWIRARHERLVDALWDSWNGSADWVVARWESLTVRVRSRREDGGGDRAERIGQSVGRRSAILGTSLCVVVMVTMAVVMLRDHVAQPAPPPTASAEPSVAVGGVDVPDVRGMPASDARAELERAGLEFAEPRAALGTPGLVLWTEPNIGRSVPPGTPVTLVIGVEAERLGSASS